LFKLWIWEKPKLISKPGEVHKNWVIFPEKINGKYVILHTINPEIKIHYLDNLDFKHGEYLDSCHGGNGNGKSKEKCWHDWIRGVGSPPLKTKYGWLVFYHAMEEAESHKYKVGAMLLDLDDPTKILYRSSHPVLEPNKNYENEGFKGGVVYVSGAVVKNEELFVYYGGADSFVCVAHCNLEEFLQKLILNKSPKIKKNSLKNK